MSAYRVLGILFWFCITESLAISIQHSRIKRSQRCFQPLGCFSNEGPYNNTEGVLPEGPDVIQTTFFLVRPNRHRAPVILVDGDSDSIRNSGFDPSLDTVFIIHGFLQSSRAPWMIEMAREFLKKRPMNAIMVDWGRGSGFPYNQASANTRIVGAEIASVIGFLSNRFGAPQASFYLIGHSLGAHIAGDAGNRVPGLRRITGLDPAQPCFSGYDPAVRLDPTDAHFVDVIHTDGSQFDEISGFGMKSPVGHVDFYPNGGSSQPGCPRESLMNLVSEEYRVGLDRTESLVSCSHSRSIFLFIDSINRCQFKGYPCQSTRDFLTGNCFTCGNMPCPEMGYNSNKYQARGTFYLATRKNSPFCGKTYLVQVYFGRDLVQCYGKLHLRLLGDNGLSEEVIIDGETSGFRASQRREVMLVSDSDLGDLMQVQLRFVEQTSLLWWRSSRLHVEEVTVVPAETGARMYFCRSRSELRSGVPAGFHISREQSCTGNTTE